MVLRIGRKVAPVNVFLRSILLFDTFFAEEKYQSTCVDTCCSMAANAGGSLYDLNDLKASMDRIETINYHETKHVNGAACAFCSRDIAYYNRRTPSKC